MKRSLIVGVALAFASGAAYAAHCPSDVKAIDEALKTAKLDDKKKAEVKKQRDEGEAHHKAGKHAEAVDSLHKAMKTLGIEHKDKK